VLRWAVFLLWLVFTAGIIFGMIAEALFGGGREHDHTEPAALVAVATSMSSQG
jgi:hypothetical protein